MANSELLWKCVVALMEAGKYFEAIKLTNDSLTKQYKELALQLENISISKDLAND